MTASPIIQEPFTPGRYSGVPIDVYHADPAVSSSSAKKLLKTVSHYLEEEFAETASTFLGSAAHAAVLEPEVYVEEFINAREPQPADGGSWYYRKKQTAELHAQGASVESIADKLGVKEKTIEGYLDEADVRKLAKHYKKYGHREHELTDSQIEQINQMHVELQTHPAANWLLFDCEGDAEHSFWWDDEATGVRCRCRPDRLVWTPAGWVIVDLKTCRDASYWSFRKDVARYKYHLQAAFYIDGANHHLDQPVARHLFVCVEKAKPYAVAVYELDHEAIERGRDMYRDALRRWHEYQTTEGAWPGYGGPDQWIQPMTVPTWGG